MRKVLVLSDRKPGHYNQSFGIVKALDMLEPITMYKVELKFSIKILRSVLKYLLKRKWAKPIFQKQASLKLIPFFYKIDMKRILPEYDYIVSTGGDTSFLNAWITMAHSEVFSIYNGHPRGVRAQYFDVVTTVIDLDLPNQIILDVAPTVIEINQNKDIPKILQKFGLLSKHYFVLLIGGNGAGYTYTDEDIANLINGANYLSRKLDISWLVTTSRRTDIEHEKRLKDSLEASYFVDYNKEAQKVMSDFLTLADTIFVTEESSSMISEAIASAKPVVTLSPKDANPDKNYQRILAKFKKCKRIQKIKINALKKFEYQKENFEVIRNSSSFEISKSLKGYL